MSKIGSKSTKGGSSIFSIRNKLFISFVLILLIPLSTMSQIFYQTAKTKVSEQMTQSSNESIKLLDKLLTSILVSTMNNVDNLSRNINSSLYDKVGSPMVMKYLDPFQKTHPEITSAYLGTESGLTMIAPYAKIAGDYDPRTRPWYQDAMKNKGKVYITEPYLQIDNATNKPTGNVIVSVVKATEDGSGVVGMDLNLSRIAHTSKDVRIGKEGYVAILDKQDKVLVHPTAAVGSEFKHDWVKEINAQKSGEFDYNYEGKEKKMTFLTNSLTGWKLLGTMDQQEISKEASSINKTIFLVITLAILFGGIVIFFIVRSIMRPLFMLVGSAEKISQGDLTENIVYHRKDEIGKLADAFNQMIVNLHQLIHQVSSSAQHVAASAEELTASAEETGKATEQITLTIQDVAVGSEKQVSHSLEVANMVSEISKEMDQAASSIQSVADSTVTANQQAANGNQVVSQAIQQMNVVQGIVDSASSVVNKLGDKSKEIGQIVGLITEIASQTNLLALNAAIEAARAGENGRGFAVVADEVRKLAEESAKAAGEIRELIQQIQVEAEKAVGSMSEGTQAVKEGITRVNLTGDAFKGIVEMIKEISTQSQEVSAIIEQVNVSSQNMVNMMGEVAHISQQSSCNTQNVAAAAEEQNASMAEVASSTAALSEMAQELKNVISRFKV